MKKEIIINSTLNEERIAITEDGKLAELYIELPDKERSIGNIYLGRVTKIVEGINAAFINIGLNQDAFLHFSDIDESLDNLITDDEDEELYEKVKQKKIKKSENLSIQSTDISLRKTKTLKNGKNPEIKTAKKTHKRGRYQINIENRQNIIVQVVREAYSSKGVKVSTKIGIPGRYVVLMPFDDVIGISKKISSLRERRRLRQLARNSLPEGYGCIIRTAAQSISEKELRKDWESLVKIWKEIEQKSQKKQRACTALPGFANYNKHCQGFIKYRLHQGSCRFKEAIQRYYKLP